VSCARLVPQEIQVQHLGTQSESGDGSPFSLLAIEKARSVWAASTLEPSAPGFGHRHRPPKWPPPFRCGSSVSGAHRHSGRRERDSNFPAASPIKVDIVLEQQRSPWWKKVISRLKEKNPTLRVRKLIQPYELRMAFSSGTGYTGGESPTNYAFRLPMLSSWRAKAT
jgi:hypothetical protein